VNLEDTNIIAGPNASGKTNLIRLLKFLSTYTFISQSDDKAETSLEKLALHKSDKLNSELGSKISIKFILTSAESKLFAQILSRKSVKIKTTLTLELEITWSNTPNYEQTPTHISLKIDDLILIWTDLKKTYFIKLDPIASNFLSDIENLFSLPTDHFARDPIYEIPKLFINYFETGRFDIRNSKFEMNRSVLSYKRSDPENYVAEVFEYCGIDYQSQNELAISFGLWNFLPYIFYKNLNFLSETRIPLDNLADKLFILEKGQFNDLFDKIRNGFEYIFPATSFKILLDYTKDRKPFIQISERHVDRVFLSNIETSASGYYEIVSIFYSLYYSESSILILDEPALHLHPIKIKLLSRFLNLNLHKQIILVTHSPYFVNDGVFNPPSSLFYFKKKNGKTLITNRVNEYALKPHTFNSDIFFSNGIIMVEGPSDASVFFAISDHFSALLERMDVYIFNCKGKGGNKEVLPHDIRFQTDLLCNGG